MYAKIEKGNSGNYMLLEVKAQVSFGSKRVIGLDVWDYMIAQEQTNGECYDDSEHAANADRLLELLGFGNGEPLIFLPEPRYKPRYGCTNEVVPTGNVTISGINVDGVNYLTTGNIFIVNECGKTIQRV